MPNSIVWTAEEDETLRHLVVEYGDRRWSLIADKLRTNKGSKQCRRRWKNCLSLDVKKGSWSEQEDDILQKAHAVHGNRWTLIAKMVGGRTDNAVKNRWAALARRKNATGSKRSKRAKSACRQGWQQSEGSDRAMDTDVPMQDARKDVVTSSKLESCLTQVLPCKPALVNPGTTRCPSTKTQASARLPMEKLSSADSLFTAAMPSSSLPDGLLLNLPNPRVEHVGVSGGPDKNILSRELQNPPFITDFASPRALLGEVLNRPVSIGRDPAFPSNREDVDPLRGPCFTHLELEMLKAALQTCPP